MNTLPWIRTAHPARWIAPGVLALLLAAPLEAGPGDAARDAALNALLDAAYGPQRAAAATHGREMFENVLSQPLFERTAVGPFDLYVCRSGALANPKDSHRVLTDAAAGLGKAAAVLGRLLDHTDEPGRTDSLVAGHRFPIVLASSGGAAGVNTYEQVVALLDRCEDDGYSGWKPVNAVWCAANLGAEVTRTWEVQVFNLAHSAVASKDKSWFEHGLGYYALAHVANRLLRQGAWGNVPPWLAQGLIDELDIEAYGQAWVGGDWWTSQTAGWSREGWSGFVPQGSSPPPPVTGPPAELAVTVKKTGHPWEQREASAQRHWTDLVADRKSAAPASFAFMAQHESFFPRDRAYARCVLNLVLDVAPAGPGLLQDLDHAGHTPQSGMPDADPLPVVFARALGVSLPDLDDLEHQNLQAMLTAIGHDEIADRLRALGAADVLAIPDHRAQADWLVHQPRFAPDARRQIFDLILGAEYYEQLREWKLIGQHLDAAVAAAFKVSATYPKAAAERTKVASAFRAGLSAN